LPFALIGTQEIFRSFTKVGDPYFIIPSGYLPFHGGSAAKSTFVHQNAPQNL